MPYFLSLFNYFTYSTTCIRSNNINLQILRIDLNTNATVLKLNCGIFVLYKKLHSHTISCILQNHT